MALIDERAIFCLVAILAYIQRSMSIGCLVAYLGSQHFVTYRRPSHAVLGVLGHTAIHVPRTHFLLHSTGRQTQPTSSSSFGQPPGTLSAAIAGLRFDGKRPIHVCDEVGREMGRTGFLAMPLRRQRLQLASPGSYFGEKKLAL
ncbi:hypothetical protein IF2G_06154 [Cordyceps javanica]|nr:hypothetical protein IF2G_06154 [Cordyceps javanica]